ncbi:MAG: alanine--tRNA ligase, partial [Promethearchaeota archaeon]
MEITVEEFSIPFFKDNDFIRLQCPKCGVHYWTQNKESQNCGDAPCQPYTFIGNPPTRSRYSLDEMRLKFIKYFQKNEHTVISPYPIVARWRDDVYLVGASIYNFQPYVTEGVIPPPANPLVVSQPCIRMTDLDLVGPTNGRHLTIFEMGGAHAFNFPDKKVYWKDDTIRLHHEFLTGEVGVNSEDVTYKEHFWSGGGNAGPDVEACVSGLEISTLVFMKYKTHNEKYVELPIKTVDTGYGIERWMWLSQGSPSGFHAIYHPIIDKIVGLANIDLDLKLISESTRLSSTIDMETSRNRIHTRKRLAQKFGLDWQDIHKILTRIEEIYAIADHTKAVAFILSEGIIPSNVEDGYLARLLVRRTLRMLQHLSLEYDSILEITDKQILYWEGIFPQLKEMRQEILDALNIETEKYKRTLKKSSEKLHRIVQDLQKRGFREIPDETLIQLYDSHGLDPETVKELTPDIEVSQPEDFYSRIAQKHLTVKSPDASLESNFKSQIEDTPSTISLYYEDPKMKCFEAIVLSVLDKEYVILDRTCFYPESGGQVSDIGYLKYNENIHPVVDVQKVGNVILHKIKGSPPQISDRVEGEIDWERRLSLTRHHTATHILIGAARRLFGNHAWQAGARKDVDKSRLDITHYCHITTEDLARLEEMAFTVITKDISVKASWMPRDKAERLYGFRIYQGGAVPGKNLRIIKVGDWDVEACGGTHC